MEIKFQQSIELFFFFFQSDYQQQEHYPDFKTVTFLKQKPKKSISGEKKIKIAKLKTDFCPDF